MGWGRGAKSPAPRGVAPSREGPGRGCLGGRRLLGALPRFPSLSSPLSSLVIRIPGAGGRALLPSSGAGPKEAHGGGLRGPGLPGAGAGPGRAGGVPPGHSPRSSAPLTRCPGKGPAPGAFCAVTSEERALAGPAPARGGRCSPRGASSARTTAPRRPCGQPQPMASGLAQRAGRRGAGREA